MALSGLNVTFGVMYLNQNRVSVAPIYGPSTSSDTMATAATSSVSAPTVANLQFQAPMASVYASADAWITVGANPADPSVDSPSGGRRFIPATTPVDFLCNSGDKVRWAAA